MLHLTYILNIKLNNTLSHGYHLTKIFSIYIHFVRFVIYSDVERAMFWFSCILITSLIGISLVLIGCSERRF